MHFFYIPGFQVYILTRHLERGLPQNFLQAEDVPAVYQETHTECMPAEVGVQLGHLRRFFNPLEHLLYNIASAWVLVFVEEQPVLIR